MALSMGSQSCCEDTEVLGTPEPRFFRTMSVNCGILPRTCCQKSFLKRTWWFWFRLRMTVGLEILSDLVALTSPKLLDLFRNQIHQHDV